MIYLDKFDYSDLKRGERKTAETGNGRALLKKAVSEIYGIDTDTMTIKKGEHGKPYFEERQDIYFNISHSGDYVAVMVGDSPLGVDIQTIRPVKERMIEKICSEEEKSFVYNSLDKDRAFITLWTLKESYIKAIGTGMSFPMSGINFDLSRLNQNGTGEISNQSGVYLVRDFGEFVLSACAFEKEKIENAEWKILFDEMSS